ncbi:MAG: RdgB/HAM1 family non-canonical purine NTP pyrophosphatase [Gammaproteobacteria bacterium]
MTKVVFASSNPGKIRELQNMLQDYHLTIIPQSEFNVRDIPETGLTFVENAILKARNASRETGLPALADDSGLEVTALKGAPGIFSARYAGPKATSQDNIQKLLSELEHVPDDQRSASFHCVLVYLAHAEDPTPLICQGTWSGMILASPRGEQGFGYDPVFFDPNLKCSAAELTQELKNKVSHRGKALRLLMEHMPEKLHESTLSQ